MTQSLLRALDPTGQQPWFEELRQLLASKDKIQRQVDRKSQAYQALLDSLPELPAAKCHLDQNWVTIGCAAAVDEQQQHALQNALCGLRPWRKGPFNVFGIEVDSEWVSWQKWQRLQPHLAALAGRRILDIGSSCGYYLFRMSPQQPLLLLGLEPYATFYYQFRLLQQLAKVPNCYTIPAKFEELPLLEHYFDTVFHMGVLYHVRSPLDTLTRIRRTLRRGGELVLETLVIPGAENYALSPRERYAKMNNVYFLPTVNCLLRWLEICGFVNGRCVDVTPTTTLEQRKTAWIQTESLADFLDPDDATKTVEGYPAPCRALVIAEAK